MPDAPHTTIALGPIAFCEIRTHAAANQIAKMARKTGRSVTRSAAAPRNRSVYLTIDGKKIRVADHPPSPRARRPWRDVWVGDPRDDAISVNEARRLVRSKFLDDESVEI